MVSLVVFIVLVLDVVVMVTILTLPKAQMTPPSRSHRIFEEHSARVDSGEPKSVFSILLQSCVSAGGVDGGHQCCYQGAFQEVNILRNISPGNSSDTETLKRQRQSTMGIGYSHATLPRKAFRV